MPGEFGAGDPVEHAGDQAIAQRGEVRRVPGEIALSDPDGLGEPDDTRDVFGPGAAIALVSATVQLRLDPHAGAHDQAANALRTTELVHRHGQQVDTQPSDPHRNVSRVLHGYGAETRLT